jgi:hypothetical protein
LCLVLLLTPALLGCDSDRSPTALSAILPVEPVPVSLVAFTERGSGFSTTDVRDAEGRIVQINTARELVWTADGSRLPGYTVDSSSYASVFFIVGTHAPKVVRSKCASAATAVSDGRI